MVDIRFVFVVIFPAAYKQLAVLDCDTSILAYHLIRAIIAPAASGHNLPPRTISFKGAVPTLEAFHPLIAIHRVADRPDRIEPRL